MALLVVAVFTLQELARAARSAEKLLDTLNREMPATLQDLRLTGKELAVLSDEVSGSVQSARSVVQQVDQGLIEAKVHAQRATITTRSLFAGATAAFRVLTGQPRRRRSRPPTRRPPVTPVARTAEVPKPKAVHSPSTVDSPNTVGSPNTVDSAEAKQPQHTAPDTHPKTVATPGASPAEPLSESATPSPATTSSANSSPAPSPAPSSSTQTQPAEQAQSQTSQNGTDQVNLRK